MKRYDTQDRNNNFKTQILMEAAKGVADATASMAAGAMSAMSAQASMRYEESMSLDD